MTEVEIIKRKIVLKEQLIEIVRADVEELSGKLREIENDDSSTPH